MPNLITLKEAKQYLGFLEEDEHDTLLTAIIASVTKAIEKRCARGLVQAAYTETRNGRGVRGMRVLNPPVAASPAPTASENGEVLTVTTGYTTTADVTVDLTRGIFYRLTGPSTAPLVNSARPGVWDPGIQNIVLGYTGGLATIPDDLKLCAKYCVGFLWKQTDRKEVGVSRRSSGQGSTEFLENVPEIYQAMIDSYRLPYVAEA